MGENCSHGFYMEHIQYAAIRFSVQMIHHMNKEGVSQWVSTNVTV